MGDVEKRKQEEESEREREVEEERESGSYCTLNVLGAEPPHL